MIVVAPNIRPSIDQEDLAPAELLLAKVSAKLRTLQLGGLEGLAKLSSAPFLPSAYALGRMMRFSSGLSDLIKDDAWAGSRRKRDDPRGGFI